MPVKPLVRDLNFCYICKETVSVKYSFSLCLSFTNEIRPTCNGNLNLVHFIAALNLLEFVSEAIHVVESGHYVEVVCKAFDRVLHSSLSCKLRELAMHSLMLCWIRSYLNGRTQCVKLLGWKSQAFTVTSGISQGSHLGPLLFLLFFNDVTGVIKSSKCLLYADEGRSEDKVVQRLFSHAERSFSDKPLVHKEFFIFERGEMYRKVLLQGAQSH